MDIVSAVLAELYAVKGEPATGLEATQLAAALWPRMRTPWATRSGVTEVLEYFERIGVAKRLGGNAGRYALTEDGQKAAARKAGAGV